MVIAMLLFQGMDAVAKILVQLDISAIQVIAIRSWLMLPAIVIVLMMVGKVSLLKTEKPMLHCFRGGFSFLAPFCYFTALKWIPIADATVIFFAATFMLTIGSAVFFKEQVGIHRWSAVVLGFIGVIVAINPQGGGDLFYYLMVLLGTTVYAISFLLGKYLSTQDSVIGLVFWLNLGMGIIGTAFLPWIWVPVTTEALMYLILMTSIAMVAHYAIAASFKRAEVSLITPFEYTALIWAAILGYLIWDEIPEVRVWIGAVIIVASGLYVIHREHLKSGVSSSDDAKPEEG